MPPRKAAAAPKKAAGAAKKKKTASGYRMPDHLPEGTVGTRLSRFEYHSGTLFPPRTSLFLIFPDAFLGQEGDCVRLQDAGAFVRWLYFSLFPNLSLSYLPLLKLHFIPLNHPPKIPSEINSTHPFYHILIPNASYMKKLLHRVSGGPKIFKNPKII